MGTDMATGVNTNEIPRLISSELRSKIKLNSCNHLFRSNFKYSTFIKSCNINSMYSAFKQQQYFILQKVNHI